MLGSSSQIDKILKEKNKAFKVLIATQNKLKASCKKATDFISKNATEITKKENEIESLDNMNGALYDQINMMNASIGQTENIINPPLVKVEEAVNTDDVKAEEAVNTTDNAKAE